MIRPPAVGLRPSRTPQPPSVHGRECEKTGALARSVCEGQDGSAADLDKPGGGMDEEALNMSVRRFLKTLGVTAQREIELAVREGVNAGDLRGDEALEATATVAVRGLPRDVVVTGTISLS
jgi:Family of unknown function (DUF6494)